MPQPGETLTCSWHSLSSAFIFCNSCLRITTFPIRCMQWISLKTIPPKNGGLSKGSVPKMAETFRFRIYHKIAQEKWDVDWKVVSHSQPQRCNSKDELRSPTAQLLSWDKKRFASQQKLWKDICTSTKKKECMQGLQNIWHIMRLTTIYNHNYNQVIFVYLE